jgi:hypothetical protein
MKFATDILKRAVALLFAGLLLFSLVESPSPARAQEEDTTFTARLSGSNQAPPLTTQASGELTATLDGDSLFVTGSFENLSAAYTASHLHTGLAGQDGGVEIGLTATTTGNTSGEWDIQENRFELTAAQKEMLLDRELYVNVHSEKYTAGEIRGQLLMEADAHYEAVLSGGSQVPANNTTASGNLVAELHGDSLLVSGAFKGLSDTYSASHFHLALAGQNGGVEIGLSATGGTNDTTGTWSIDENRYELTAAQKTALQARELYVNVHSAAYPGGEVRGQVTPRSDPYFEATLTGTAKTSPVVTEASGNMLAEVRGDSLFVSGAFEGLSSAYAASHLHVGLAGASGGVEIPLSATSTNGDTSGTWATSANAIELTSEQKDLLWDRELYINVHSSDHGGGEIRGQVLPISSLYFQTTLSGMNEVDPDTSSATGGAVAELSGDRLTVSGAFSDLTADLATSIRGGAHIHAEGPGANGSIAYDLGVTSGTDLTSGAFAATDNMLTLSLDTTEMLRDGQLYVNVHSTTFQTGEIRGQLLLGPNSAPDSTGITAPADSAIIEVSGSPSSEYSASWESSSDPNDNDVVYIYQLSTISGFENDSLVFNDNVGSNTTIAVIYDSLDTILENEGIEMGSSTTWHHRVIASDGSNHRVGESSAVAFERGSVTSIDQAQDLPRAFVLKGNYPNPFNPSTTIRFDLPAQADVTVEIFDVMGRKVMTLPRNQVAAGTNRSIQVEASTLPSGMYLYRVRAEMSSDIRVKTGQMMLVK